MAKIFWQLGEHQICSALFASFLFKKMSNKIHDEAKIELKKNAE